jgi:hypothetical protein
MRHCHKLVLLTLLLLSTTAHAQSDKPERLVVEQYHFAFTFEKGSIVTYSEGSNGASGIRFPDGASTTESPDYRVLVYGKDGYLVSVAEARKSGIDPAEEQFLQATAYPTAEAWNEQFTKIMATHERTVSGQAIVKLGSGQTRSVPYFSWSRSIGDKTHYALMYVTIHNGAFIAVQVEGSRPFGEASISALTSKLELLDPPASPSAPATN